MNAIRIALPFTFALLSTPAFADTLSARVNGMVCAFCAQGIDKSFRAHPDTQDVYINLKKKIVAVELKPGATLAPDKFKAMVKDAGYDVEALETVKRTAAEIRAANK